MSVHAFGDEQVDKARHALGLDREKRAYRNFYCANGPDADWEDLVARGFAVVRRESPLSSYTIYHLTKRSAFFFLNEGERLDPDLRFADAP